MGTIDNYPPGAANDPSAPWNQDNNEQDYVKKDVEVCISLSNTITIETNDYITIIDEDYDVDYDEDGNKIIVGGRFESEDFSETSWIKAYKEDECNIITLLKEYGEIIKLDIETYTDSLNNVKQYFKEHSNDLNAKKRINVLKDKIKLLKRKYKACNEYVIDDIEVFEA